MPSFVTVADVRGYLNVAAPSPDSGQYGSGNIGSNIKVASGFLERMTHRQFDPQTATAKTFTSEGRAYLSIPDLRSATSVTLQGAALTADQSYWLIPDSANDGIYTGIQFRQFSRMDYRNNPEWFDRNLDSWLFWARENNWGSLPNDLVITGDWGWSPLPDELLMATKVLASWFTLRPDAVLSNVIQSAQGTVSDVSQLPPEVQSFISAWTLQEMTVSVG